MTDELDIKRTRFTVPRQAETPFAIVVRVVRELQAFAEDVWEQLRRIKATLRTSGRRLRAPQILTTGTAATYVPAEGAVVCRTRVLGPGGGGGGTTSAAASAAAGGGGAAGAWGARDFVVAGAAFKYTIGSGGAGGTAAGGNGGTGTASTFTDGRKILTALGGAGGVGMTAGVDIARAAGGVTTAVATGGDINSGGAPGEASSRDTGLIGRSGSGASGPYGAGGNGLLVAGAGVAGVGFGAGGGGGVVLNGSAAVAGGAGAGGLIIVEDFA